MAGINVEAMDYLSKYVLKPIQASNVREAMRCATLQALGSPSGAQYYGALTGRPLSKETMETLRHSTASLRASSYVYDGSQFVFLGDFIAEDDDGVTDKKTLAWLRTAARETMDQAFDVSLITNNALALRHGIAAVQHFFEEVLRSPLNPSTASQWTWADTLMVILIITTSALWERRLARIFDLAFLPTRAIASIARYVMRESYGKEQEPGKPTCDFDPLLTTTALAVLHASESLVLVAV